MTIAPPSLYALGRHRGPEIVRAIAPKPPPPLLQPDQQTQDPDEELQDLQVKPPLDGILTPPLRAMGFDVDKHEVSEKYSGRLRVHTVIRKNGLERYLLHMATWILEEPPKQKNLDAVGHLEHLFKSNATLFIFCTDLLVLPRAFDRIIKKIWPSSNGIKGNFVSWKYVEELERSGSQQEKEEILKDILELEALPAHVRAARALSEITPDHLQKVTRLIGNFPQFHDGGERGRRVVVRNAGLKDVVGNFGYDGEPETIAGDLIARLIDYGPMPTDPDQQALGVLLLYFYKRRDLAPEDVSLIQDIWKVYGLQPSLPDHR